MKPQRKIGLMLIMAAPFWYLSWREFIGACRRIGFWRVVWYRTLYRPVMRWMHRHHIHHMHQPPISTSPRCYWCGMIAQR